MKRLVYILALLASAVAFGQTHYPYTTIPPTIAADTLLGNPTGSIAAPSQITLGSGLSFSGTTLTSSGGGGSPGGSSGNIQYNNSSAFGGGNISGDCTTAVLVITCTETNGTAFGTFATQNYATPPAIGGTTPAAGAFTTLAASGAVSGTGFSTYLASPPAIGGTAPAGGAFTTLSATGAVSGAGFSTYLASPPAIGGTAAAGGAFTTLTASSTVSGTGFSTYLASPPAIGGTAPAAITATSLTTGGAVAFTASPVTISGNISSATGNANGYGLVGGATPNYTDTSAAGGTVTNAYMNELPAPNLETTTTTTYSNVYTLNIPAPTCSTGGGGTPTCTTKWSLSAGAGILVSIGNMQVNGGNVQVGNSNQFLWAGRGILTSAGAGNYTLGATAAASPVAATIEGQGASGSNISGAALTIEPGPGTGTGTGATLTLATPHNSGTGGSTAQSFNTQITLGDNTVALNNIASATSAQTGYLCYGTSGNITYDGTNTCLVSAAKFKKSIKPLNTGLKEVLQLKPVSYYLRNPFPGDANMKNEQIGFVAEDVAKVEPRLVSYDKNKEIHGVRYEQMAALLAKGEQDIQAEVVALRAQNLALAARLAVLEHPKKSISKAVSK
jgi:hypothetical protein